MELKKQVINDTLGFSLVAYYQGNYEDIPTETLMDMIEANEKLANRKNLLRKVMFLSVEAIQNIQRYSAHQGYHSDYYLIFYDGGAYQVVTQNLIYNKNKELLNEKLEVIISKDQNELDELYLNKLDSEEKTEKGAGLGLIEIARKSRKSIHYEIENVDEEFSLFKLYFAIPMTKIEDSIFDFSKAKSVQSKLDKFSVNNESSFYFGGDFSNNFISSLLKLLLSKKAEQKNNANKKVHHVIIELTQNIKKHSQLEKSSANGRMFVEWKKENIEITTSNLTTLDNSQELQKKAVHLNSLNKEQLAQRSKEILADLETTNGLGLVDVANMIYPNKLNVEIDKKDSEHVELLFNIKINNE